MIDELKKNEQRNNFVLQRFYCKKVDASSTESGQIGEIVREKIVVQKATCFARFECERVTKMKRIRNWQVHFLSGEKRPSQRNSAE